MFVWQWVQQHRLLSVLILAFVVVSTAGGTAWALVFRTVSSPVGFREALRMYRKEQAGKMLASLRTRLPEPGVYAYRTSGGEGLNLPGVQRSFPPATSMIVEERRCATISWVPIVQHTETITECAGPGGGLFVPKLVTHESIAGSDTTSTIDCPSTAYLVPPSVRPGQRWNVTCRLENPAEKAVLDAQALGTSTMVVAGHHVRVEHTRFSLTFSGTEHGTNPTDFWVVPEDGLIVRERERVDITTGTVRYEESMETTLAGLVPAR